MERGESQPWHGGRGLMLPRQGAEPIPRESGLCRARGALLTCYVLILVPNQILVPELRARLPCKAHQHITAVFPRTQGHCTRRAGPCGAPQSPAGLGVLLGAHPGPLKPLEATGDHKFSKYSSHSRTSSLQ